jgi:outer membrane biosynthesis protein TonB
MEYNKIIAVTGLPGLYELLSSKSDGAIVRSLDDKTTRFVASRVHNFSHLESIEVYTVRDNVNLVDVLKAMEASTEKLPDEKDNAALKGYFSKVYPDLDFDRVYSSDLKKMVKWFNVLRSNNIEIKLSQPEEAAEELTEVDEAPAPEVKKKKAAEKAPVEEKEPSKPKATKKAALKEEEEEEENPKPAAKKTAPRKAAAKEEKETAEKPGAKSKENSQKKQPEKTAAKKK